MSGSARLESEELGRSALIDVARGEYGATEERLGLQRKQSRHRFTDAKLVSNPLDVLLREDSPHQTRIRSAAECTPL